MAVSQKAWKDALECTSDLEQVDDQYVKGQQPVNMLVEHGWGVRPHAIPQVTINVDGAWVESTTLGGAGVIIRDANGRFLA